jgi:SAM-dependent methyltransferase
MGHVVGADPSALMVEIASQRNRPLIRAARIEVALVTVESLPFAGATFDKVLCVHVLYFWKDLDVSVREIARVLKPGDRLGLLFRTKADPAAIASFPAEIHQFPELAEVTVALEQAGLGAMRSAIARTSPSSSSRKNERLKRQRDCNQPIRPRRSRSDARSPDRSRPP